MNALPPTTSSNPEINTSSRQGNDARWNARIKKYEAKRAEVVKKKNQQLTEKAGKKAKEGEPPPPARFDDKRGKQTVALMGTLKELGGLRGLTGRPVGFTAEEHQSFAPALTFTDVPTDNDGQVLPSDIMQVVSDCYWVAALMAILEEHPGFLQEAVRPVDKTTRPELDQNLDWYEVDVFPRGMLGYHKETVLVSNALPPRRLASTEGNTSPDELRAILYEKAFALWQGGYNEHTWGFTGRAMANMTGHASSYAYVPGKSEEAVWKTLNKKKDRDEALVAIVMNHHEYLAGLAFLPQSMRDQQKKLAEERSPSKVGLVNKHCYSVVGTGEEMRSQMVERDGQQVAEERLTRVVYLRDPRNPGKPRTVTLEDFCNTTLLMVSSKVKKG